MNTIPSLVSVVILNWNGGESIRDCIDHVLDQTYPDVELIVIDNGSTDGSAEGVEQAYPRAILIRNQRNLGFAGGMNRGIEYATGEFVLLLNTDAFLAPIYVEAVLCAIAERPRVGAAGGMIYQHVDGEKTAIIDSVGHLLRKRIAHDFSYRGMEKGANGCISPEVRESRLVYGPDGSCPILRRTMLEDVRFPSGEYFDESYFIINEDMDLWMRAHLRGWQALYVPEAVAWHVRSVSQGRQIRLVDKANFYQRHALKNRYLTILKDLPLGLLLRLFPYLVLAEMLTGMYFAIVKPRCLVNLIGAQLDVLRLMPQVLARRKYIQSRRVVSAQSLLPLFTKF
jgi:GT2 family glycosyltransferase